MKNAEIYLPYYKQGCDLHHHLEACATVEEALDGHAKQLEAAADILMKVKEIVYGKGVTFDADTHMIMATGPDDVIDALVSAELASIPDYLEYDDDDYPEDELEEQLEEGLESE